MRPTALITILMSTLYLGGCASVQMKGTPFYTGEYEVRRGPAEDRINGWPLLYYRDPALSVLWPIGEKTEDHLAVRPLLSVYGLNRSNHVYNVLWPIARFDPGRSRHHVFPVFWGERRACAFPLYWHKRSADSKRLTDGLFPLWWYHRNSRGKSVSVAWPFLHYRNMEKRKGWRVWPVVGDYEHGDDEYRFWLWPLGHHWKDGDISGSALLPLYVNHRDAEKRRFLSLLYSRGGDVDGPAQWDTLLPLFYRHEDATSKSLATLAGGYRRDDDSTRWFCLPLLSFGEYGEDDGSFWAGGPLAHAAWNEDGGSSHLLPLFYRRSDEKQRMFISLPWSYGTDTDGTSWQLAFPWFYRNKETGTFGSPLYARWRDTEGRRTDLLPPLLSWLHQEEERSDLWTLGGLARHSWGKEPGPRHLLPLYYSDPAKKIFASPLVASWKEGGTSYRIVPPLLSGAAVGEEETDIIGLLGLFRHRHATNPKRDRGHLFPLYYYRGNNTFLTPLVGWNKSKGDGFFYPLTPLAGVNRGAYTGGWLFPLFEHNRHVKSGHVDGSFLAWGEYWKRGDSLHSSFFPLFTYRRNRTVQYGLETDKSGRYGWRRSSLLGLIKQRDEVFVYRTRMKREDDEVGTQQRRRTTKHGAFPLYKYERNEHSSTKRADVDANLLVNLYDYQRRTFPDHKDANITHDYVRRRLLWRVWHYEKSDGDVSVDAFPFITWDRKQDGFRKFSFLGRFCRFETSKDRARVDLLFLPLINRERNKE